MKVIRAKNKASGRTNGNWNPDYKVSDETRKKIGDTQRGRVLSEEHKAKISISVNKKVASGDWHTSLARNHHHNYKGVDLHCRWELEYAKWLDSNNILWSRCKESFAYHFNNKDRKYTPDFYLPETDVYVEIKGYKTDKDDAKWSQFPKHRTLTVLLEGDLKRLGVL